MVGTCGCLLGEDFARFVTLDCLGVGKVKTVMSALFKSENRSAKLERNRMAQTTNRAKVAHVF